MNSASEREPRVQRGDYKPDQQALLDALPDPTAKPCRECPWRRDAQPGHLGPNTAQEWADMAHGESPIACHMTIDHTGQDWTELRQCQGSAIFRANIFKTPRHPKIAVADRDTETVFSWDDEFIDHHTKDAHDRAGRTPGQPVAGRPVGRGPEEGRAPRRVPTRRRQS